MKEKIQKSLIAGVIATVIMSVVMFIFPLIGFPKLSPPDMVASMMDIPVAGGWVIHFVIGIAFALIYNILGIANLKFLKNVWIKGALFGVVAFVLAQVGMGIMGAMFNPAPDIEGAVPLIMANSVISHIIFGLGVAHSSK